MAYHIFDQIFGLILGLFFRKYLFVIGVLEDERERVRDDLVVALDHPVVNCPREVQRVYYDAQLFDVASLISVACQTGESLVDDCDQNVHHHDVGEDLKDEEENYRNVGLIHHHEV